MGSIVPQALSLSVLPSLSLLLPLFPPILGKTEVSMRNLCFAGPAPYCSVMPLT